MSGQSPAIILYTSTGVELDVQTNTAVPSGTGAILISGVSPSGNSNWIPATQEGVLGITQMANIQTAQSAATVTATGSFTTTNFYAGAQEAALVVDVGTVTGAGSIQYTIQEVDLAGNVYGNSASTVVINSGNAPGVFTAVLPVSTAVNIRVTWTVTGTFSATITSYVTSRSTPSTQTVNGSVSITGTVGVTQSTSPWVTSVTGTVAVTQSTSPWVVSGTVTANQGTPNSLINAWPVELTDGYGNLFGEPNNPIWVTGSLSATNPSVSSIGAAPPSMATYVGALATTSQESGLTNGDMYAFNITTTGLLRIDGHYPTGTTTANAPDMGQVGGIVTTAAPTYTTGQINALSLTTVGQLRIDSVYPTGTTTANAPDATEMGAITVAGPPTYTAGQLNALTTDVGGNLRVVTNKASTAAVTSVAVTASTPTSLLAANTSRVFASLYNNGSKGTMYVLLGGGTASASNFSITLLPSSYWEIPVDWTGAVSCFSTNVSTVLVTELTP
jgi:hypothetical protein